MLDPGTRLIGILAAACALFSMGFAGCAAWDQDWTTDERIHLGWSERFWNTGETERDSVGRYKYRADAHHDRRHPVAPQERRISHLCVATRRGTDLVGHTLEGRFDLIPAVRPDLATHLPPAERVCFRLDPGVHVFEIRETPNRRDAVPYTLSVRFASVERGALLRILRAP